MAKHETEMHRQRRIALEALQVIARHPARKPGGQYDPDITRIIALAQEAINRICEPAANGLWADRRQMDLADRKDC